VWQAQTAALVEAYDRETQTLAAQFGGRLQHVLIEYAKRGKVHPTAVETLAWDASSLHGIVAVADKIEALALGL
jgi:hypothetical protein